MSCAVGLSVICIHAVQRQLALNVVSLMILLPAALPSAAPATVIIFPPENLAGIPALTWVGEGLAVSLSQQLRIPGLDVIARNERVGLVEGADLPPNVPLSHASMIRVGQLASAGLVVMGTYSGTADKLQIALNLLDLRTMKLSGKIAANGPLNALAEMENELAWNILSNTGLNADISREQFKSRTRTIPNSAYSYYLRSLDSSDEGEQVKLLDMAVALYSNFPDAQFLLGRYFFQKGQCPQATEHLELGRKKDQSYVLGEFMLGTCYLESGSLPEAIRCYSNLLAFARPVEALNNLGVAYLRKGDYDLAVQDLLEAHNLAKNNATVALNLALLRLLQRNDTAAQAVLEEQIAAHPDNGMLQLALSFVLKSSGDPEGAAAAFARAKSLHVEVEKLQTEDPRLWTAILTTMEHRP